MHLCQKNISIDLTRYSARLVHIRVTHANYIMLIVVPLGLSQDGIILKRHQISAKTLLTRIPPPFIFHNLT